MPVGILSCSFGVFLGGLLGSIWGKYLPERMRSSLTAMFGMSSLAIGISMVVKMYTLPAVILSLLAGTVIGEGFDFEKKLEVAASKLKNSGKKQSQPGEEDKEHAAFIEKFIGILVLFCFSGMGILGAMTEGMTGDASVMLAKAILDFLTAGIFAAALGWLVMLIALPQFLVLLLCFFLAEVILPLATPAMIGDFMACGGVITLASGLRIAGIKSVRITNVLPAMVIIMPLSYAWALLAG